MCYLIQQSEQKVFLHFLQKNSGNSELSSLVPATAELTRYGIPDRLYPLPVSNLVFSNFGVPPQVCFLKFFITLFCTAGNPPNFLSNLVQRYNKILIYANYLLKKCIIFVFFMRMVHANKNRPLVADDFRQSRYSIKKRSIKNPSMRDGVYFDRRVNLYISLATCFNATIGKSQHILGI